MLFSLNYSPEMAALLRAGAISVDRIKCPEWPELVIEAAALAPVYVHFRLMAGQDLLDQEHLEMIALMREQTATPYINTHIAPRADEFPDATSRTGAKDAIRRSLEQLAERFGADAVIAENIPYPEHSSHDKAAIGVDPELISEVVEDTGVGLLLDIGHARRVAEHWAIDPRVYMARLPVHRLREVHITGLGYNPDGYRVDHMPMREADWELLQWVLDNIRNGQWAKPWAVSCEYGGVGEPFRWRSDADIIAQDAPRMAAMVSASQPETVT